ncbi:hypothetical protein EVAR_93038_1 [Eumeta japonica]|uniref:Uncharacterized protein n=1 Tax=Eumeta variegata TaxID=151549 RepID=A0A4C1THL0_EUMVA|nr:hypothetical protein EVAR_93038_1 [Eumeta japonica]
MGPRGKHHLSIKKNYQNRFTQSKVLRQREAGATHSHLAERCYQTEIRVRSHRIVFLHHIDARAHVSVHSSYSFVVVIVKGMADEINDLDNRNSVADTRHCHRHHDVNYGIAPMASCWNGGLDPFADAIRTPPQREYEGPIKTAGAAIASAALSRIGRTISAAARAGHGPRCAELTDLHAHQET